MNPIGGPVGPGQVISLTRRSAWRREYEMRAGERALGWLGWWTGRRSAAQAEGPGIGLIELATRRRRVVVARAGGAEILATADRERGGPVIHTIEGHALRWEETTRRNHWALREQDRTLLAFAASQEVVEMIDLAADAGTRIGALSGGQRRRVDLGLAVIGRPEVLFLDEPTTALDPEGRRELWAVIQSLVGGGTTVLLTTHYMEEAQRLADRVVVLAGGHVVADATPDQLRARGAAPVIRFLLPPGAPAGKLPGALAARVDRERHELLVNSADVTGDLAALVGWARQNCVDLTGLEVAPPSLEDAYLSLTTGQSPTGAADPGARGQGKGSGRG